MVHDPSSSLRINASPVDELWEYSVHNRLGSYITRVRRRQSGKEKSSPEHKHHARWVVPVYRKLGLVTLLTIFLSISRLAMPILDTSRILFGQVRLNSTLETKISIMQCRFSVSSAVPWRQSKASGQGQQQKPWILIFYGRLLTYFDQSLPRYSVHIPDSVSEHCFISSMLW